MTAHVIAVDVGGTEIKAAHVATDCEQTQILRQTRRPTPSGDESMPTADAVVGVVTEIVSDLRAGAETKIDAVGVVVPGTVDEQRGVGVYSSNLGWRDEPLRDRLTDRINLPLAFGHDVRASGLAEARLGAARGLRDAVVMPIGTGIGAALLLGGELYAAGGHAGEIGHVDVGHGQPCACGGTGCLEAVASSAAVARRFAERTGKPVSRAVEVAAAVRAGDPDARTVWSEAIDALAKGIVVLTTVLAPEAVVLGGGFASAGELLTGPLGTKLDSLMRSFHRRPELRLAQLGDSAGCLGAALLAAPDGEAK